MPTAETVPTGVTAPMMATCVTPGVKLPKLTIKKFNGDLTRWVPFWDAFQSAIHNNRSLTDIDRFNYLKSYLVNSHRDVEGLRRLHDAVESHVRALGVPTESYQSTR